MAAVIQATCPGCKKMLRIPSDWIQQAIRCKHCGLLMAAKQTPVALPAKAVPPVLKKRPDATPLPPTVAAPVALLVGPANGVVAPVAVPVTPIMASVASPFENLDVDATPRTKPSPQSGKGGWWKGPVIALGVLFLAGIALAVTFTIAWPFVGPRLFPAQGQVVVQNDSPDPQDNDGNNAPKPTPHDPDKKPEPDKKPDKPPPDKKPDTGPKTPDKPPPDKKPPDKPPPDKKPPDKKPDKPAPPAGTLFPRRALVVSVHNYLYANPVDAGLSFQGARNMSYFVTKLATGLKIPSNQIAHLSDEAAKGSARAPNKQVIEKTLDDFLGTSREQDRVLVFLIGHAVEIDGKAYFVPIEGELGKPATLIDLEWVYAEMKNCRARQKILVLDTARFSPTHGVERPGSGPMSAKFDEILKKPPEGVQVWTSCVAEQMSYETDSSVVGVFIDKLTAVLEKSSQGPAPKPDEAIPVEKLNELVTAAMHDELTKFKLTQTPRVTGKEMDGGAAYDPNAEPAKPPVLAESVNNRMNVKMIRAVLTDISTPPVKGGHFADATIKFEMLPPFSEKAMKEYEADGPSMLEGPIQKARAMLWAISTANPPEPLKKDVEEMRARLNVDLSYLKDGFKAPPNESQFKSQIANHERKIADMIDEVEHAYKQLKEVEFDRTKEPKRWVANYDFMVARMEEQIAYLFEYQSMVAQLRKELPPLDKTQGNGWKLAATPTPSGDKKGKDKAKSSAKLLDTMADERKGTPWEVLAKRERLTTLGLEWKTATVK